MITQLQIRNFRGYDTHRLYFGPIIVIVGQNNAGKSTIVETLRLLAIVTQRYRSLTYHRGPAWSDIPRNEYGVQPSLKNLEINFDSAFHRYADPPAIITAQFNNKCSVTIYLAGEERIHAVIRDDDGNIVKSREQAHRLTLPPVAIMPQVTPLQREETILSPEYIKSAMSSSLAPLHFRNQLNVVYDFFSEFRDVVQETWPGVNVLELVGQGKMQTYPLALQIRNEDFVAEVGAMGHGLQMWLQTMWFLTRSKDAKTVILDEPDVYMHADLQRRLIRFIRNRYPQVILTTHSVEIMSEVSPEEILVVDKRKRESKCLTSLPAVQQIVDRVGSVHNVHLARLWSSRRFLLLEGKDLKILKVLQDTLFPRTITPLQSIPHMSVGGWGGWNYAVGSSMAFQNAFGEKITVYCVLDSDYHTQEEISQRLTEARNKGIELHIWSQKEIENYLICPGAIRRYVNKRLPYRTSPMGDAELNAKLSEICANMDQDVFDALSAEYLARDRSLGSGGANKKAREHIKQVRGTSSILSLVSGKDLFSCLSTWTNATFGVSITTVGIAQEMTLEEIPGEMAAVLTSIEKLESFTSEE